MIRAVWDRYLHAGAVERALVVKRRSPLWLRAGIVFVHVPKAAGTSISEALYGRITGHVRAIDVARWGSSGVRRLPRVAVVRNPWDRLVSSYRFIKNGGGIGGPNVAGIWRSEQYEIPEFSSFESFVNDWLVHKDVRRLDGVFQPQSQFVSHHGEIIVDHLGRFEALDETYRYLADHVQRLPRFEYSNRSGDPVDYRAFYTPELIECVGEIYADDVGLFGFKFGETFDSLTSVAHISADLVKSVPRDLVAKR